MWSIRTFDQQRFASRNIDLISREATELLREQEKLLNLPMSAADMLLYEMRDQQISELIRELSFEDCFTPRSDH